MDKVLKCVTDIERKLGKIDAMTSKGANNLTLKDMIKMAQKGNSINSTINKGIKAYAGVIPTEAESLEIIKHMEHIVALEEKSMTFAIENKPNVDKLHAAGMVKKNLKKNETIALTWSKLCIEKTPPSLLEQAKVLDKRAMEAFNKGLAAYSDATGGEELVDDQAADSD